MRLPVLADTLAEARARLVSTGLSAADAAADVDVLARHALGWDRAKLLSEQNAPAPPTLEPRFSELLERRIKREPTAYILGLREFWGLEFKVSPAVLIPRPETEFIVEEALPLIARLPRPRVADVGTGSGNIAVSIAVEAGHARVTATDLSAEALAVARENAATHRVADRVEFVQTSYLDGVDGPFDLIAANPPYVRDGDKPALSRDVRHEPDVALFGGRDGMRDVAGVLQAAVRTLAPSGWLLMEFGYGQEEDVRAQLTLQPLLRLDRIRDDLQGIARTAIIQRP
jgi:release factor glutamine methyltransferase